MESGDRLEEVEWGEGGVSIITKMRSLGILHQLMSRKQFIHKTTVISTTVKNRLSWAATLCSVRNESRGDTLKEYPGDEVTKVSDIHSEAEEFSSHARILGRRFGDSFPACVFFFLIFFIPF